MKSKGLLTASFLLLLLTGVLWWSNKRAAKADKEPIKSTTTKLVGIPEDQLQEIEIKRRSGETVRLQRNDSKWQITAPNLSHPMRTLCPACSRRFPPSAPIAPSRIKPRALNNTASFSRRS